MGGLEVRPFGWLAMASMYDNERLSQDSVPILSWAL